MQVLTSKDNSFGLKSLSTLVNQSVERSVRTIEAIHHRKLKNLGIDLDKKVDTNRVIFNFSNRVLTQKEKEALSLGLDFCLRPKKVGFVKFFIPFERMCHLLKNCMIYEDTFNSVFRKIALLANSTYVQQNQETYSSDFTEQVTNSLQNLKSDEHIVITKPDKGRGIVLLSRTDYINKLSSILSDSSKFQLLNVNLATHLLKLEDKLNRIIRPLKTILDETIYHSIFSAGSRAGFMYGLPKVHKPGLPLRPIISSIGTFSYNLAKFLVQIIQPLTYNEYTISNSSNFINEISHLRFDDTITMASFDVESLFTNVPLAETTQIITNNTTAEFLSQFGLEKKQLLSLLIVVTKDSVFTFDNRLYTQIDGVAMGSPIGPSYANAFLCYHERKWLQDCPLEFKPLFYKRYIDDTFLVFKHPSHIQLFLSYLNDQHRNIKFTCEIEKENQLSFLDTLITKENGRLYTTVYRKPTFTGLGMHYLSYSPQSIRLIAYQL